MTSRGRLLVQKALGLAECNISAGDYVINEDGSLSMMSSSCNTETNSLPTNVNIVNITPNNLNINRPSHDKNQEQSVYGDTRTSEQNLEMVESDPYEENFIVNEDTQFLENAVDIFEDSANLNVDNMQFEEEDEYNHDENNSTDINEGALNLVEDTVKLYEDADVNLDEDNMNLEENVFNNDEEANILNEDTLNLVEDAVNHYEETTTANEHAMSLGEDAFNNDTVDTLNEDAINIGEDAFNDDIVDTPNEDVNLETEHELVGLQQDSDETGEPRKTTRKKRHQVNPNTWKIKEWQAARRKGKAYRGKKNWKMENGNMI